MLQLAISQAPRNDPRVESDALADRLPRILLRTEGGAVAAAAIAIYFHEGYPWWLFSWH